MRDILALRILWVGTAAKDEGFWVHLGPDSCVKGLSMFQPDPFLQPCEHTAGTMMTLNHLECEELGRPVRGRGPAMDEKTPAPAADRSLLPTTPSLELVHPNLHLALSGQDRWSPRHSPFLSPLQGPDESHSVPPFHAAKSLRP